MARLDNVTRGEFEELRRQVRIMSTTTPGGNTSISSGRTRFVGNESLLVEGSQKVSGILDITGTLKGVGSMLWNGFVTLTSTFTAKGTTRFEGDTTQVGPHHVQGNQDITGTLAVKGAATLESNLTVNSPGKIVVGAGLSLEPLGAGGGTINFLPTGSIYAGLGKLTLLPPDLTAIATIGASVLAVTGDITSSKSVALLGPNTTTDPANAVIMANGFIRKGTSAARFKIDPQPIELPDALLAVPVKSWIDKAAAEEFAALHYDTPRPLTEQQTIDLDCVKLSRVPGIIAEEVEAAGGSAFVGYDADGQIESVAYERLALARTEILARQLKEALAQIADLRAQLSN
jgi:hypothetical protein